MEMIETLRHPVCMNFATISPDSRILAAVGDANQIWFYRAEQVPDERDTLPNGDGFLPSWKWPRIGKIDLDSDPNYDDQCCFTIAFSPCSSLCAVGSQGGIITIFDVNRILTASPILRNRGDEVVCVFRSSRSFFDGGAIRCMTFSPRPWDLLVWVEDHGKIGVADMRQAFSRRQIVTLDMEEKGIEKIRTENLDKIDDDEGSEAESESQSSREPVRPPEESRDSGRIFRRRAPEGRLDTQTMREELARDLTARERQIIDFLNTARWASSIEDGAQRIPRYVSPLPLSRSPPPHGSRHSPLSTSPPEHFSSRHESARDRNVQRTRAGEPRRRSSVILSQDNSSSSGPSNTSNSALIPHPTITLRWTASPSQIPPSDSPFETAPTNPSGTTSIHINAQNNPAGYRRDGTEVSAQRARVLFDRSLGINTNGNGPPRQWGQRSRSIPRRSERPPDPTAELAADPPGGPTAEMRTNLAAERLRYQRRAAIEEGQRLSQWEQQYRRLTEFDQIRNNPRLRNLRGDFSSDRPREDMGIGTAGVGWGDDGRTL